MSLQFYTYSDDEDMDSNCRVGNWMDKRSVSTTDDNVNAHLVYTPPVLSCTTSLTHRISVETDWREQKHSNTRGNVVKTIE